MAAPDEMRAITRLGPAIAISGLTEGGPCSCPQRNDCDAPGAHPLHDLWWDIATWNPAVLDRWLHSTSCPTAAVLLTYRTAVLQVPANLRPVLQAWLGRHPDPPPIVHAARRSWVWLRATIQRPDNNRRTLPPPQDLTMLTAGAWIPVPTGEAHHRPWTSPEAPLTWGAPPTGQPLPPAARDGLIASLIHARNAAPSRKNAA